MGPGLGAGDDPEALLDKVSGVTPLRALGLKQLEGRQVCAVVWESDISINYDGPPLGINGSLKGANYGIVAFEVGIATKADEAKHHSVSSSTLPIVDVTILNAEAVCAAPLSLFDAPEPSSSSEPQDVDPISDEDDEGYLP